MPKPRDNRFTRDHAALLVEYQKAQDSAEHHDRRIANLTSLWVGTAVLMGFVLCALKEGGGSRPLVGTGVACRHRKLPDLYGLEVVRDGADWLFERKRRSERLRMFRLP